MYECTVSCGFNFRPGIDQGNDVHPERQFFGIVAGAAGKVAPRVNCNPPVRELFSKSAMNFPRSWIDPVFANRDLEFFIGEVRQEFHFANG